MNITISNPLSGEHTRVMLPEDATWASLEDILYERVFPTAPLGCIVYHCLSAVSAEKVLADGMRLIAFVDPSRVTVRVKTAGRMELLSPRKLLDRFNVAFYPHGRLPREAERLWTVCALYDPSTERWALWSEFDTSEDARGHLRATEHTRWFPHLYLCLLTSTDRISKDPMVLGEVNRILVEQDWYDPRTENEEDAWEDDTYMDPFELQRHTDADHDFRWERLNE